MRVSIEHDDPGFVADADRRFRLRISLDGELQQGVVTADEEKGLVLRDARDERGMLIVDGDEIRLETVKGQVVITEECA